MSEYPYCSDCCESFEPIFGESLCPSCESRRAAEDCPKCGGDGVLEDCSPCSRCEDIYAAEQGGEE